jgi:heat shock protein HtpX
MTSPHNKIIYSEIMQNRFKTFLLLLLLPLALGALLFAVLYFYFDGQTAGNVNMNTVIALALRYIIPVMTISLLWMLFAGAFGGSIALQSAGAVQVSEQSHPEIYRMVRSVAQKAGLPVPKIYIMNDMALNAFATGSNPRTASIALTRGIIGRLDQDELEGVIAHEMSHIGNRDTLIMTLVAVGISVFTMVGQQMMYSHLFYGGRRDNRDNSLSLIMVLGIVFLIFGYLVAPLIQFAVSRRREFQADACAAQITGRPQALASALAKIAPQSKVSALKNNESIGAMCIENPTASKSNSLYMLLSGLYSTHPPIAQRIEKLKQMRG